MNLSLIKSPFENDFKILLGKTKRELTVSSPYINEDGIDIFSNAIRDKSKVRLNILTNLSVRNIIDDVTQPSALLKIYDDFKETKISSLAKLHAKVYVVDEIYAVITSANLTSGGLIGNFEYGVLIEDSKVVSTIKDDMLKYYSLGNILDKILLEKINEESSKLHRIKNRADDIGRNTKLAKLLKKSTENLDFELLKNRVKEKTVNAIFSDTILYLLKKKGRLSTEELHPLIQSIHPDICDDSIDRIVNGQHFGKKWKHLVRDAQQFLKRKRLICSEEGRWLITN